MNPPPEAVSWKRFHSEVYNKRCCYKFCRHVYILMTHGDRLWAFLIFPQYRLSYILYAYEGNDLYLEHENKPI